MVLTTGMLLPMIQIGDTVRPGMAVAQFPTWRTGRSAPKLRNWIAATWPRARPSRWPWWRWRARRFRAHVKSLGNTIGDPWDRNFDCRMTLDSAGPELRPGMTSNLVITAEKLDDVLWVALAGLVRTRRPVLRLPQDRRRFHARATSRW